MGLYFELSNFKAFESTGRIELRPITLIYGPNSSGKSSVLQSLLLLKQTIEEAENPTTLLLPKGALVDLGGYREFVHRHELERPFSFQLVTELGKGARHRREVDPYVLHHIGDALPTKHLGLRVTFGYDERAANAVVSEYAFFADGSEAPFAWFKPYVVRSEEETKSQSFMYPGARSGTFLKGSGLNADHPYWRALAALIRSYEESHTPELNRRLAYLERKLNEVEAASNAGATFQRTARRSRRKSKEDIESEIAALKASIAEAERPWQEYIASIEEDLNRTMLITRNFLPFEAMLLPEEAASSDDLVQYPLVGRFDVTSAVFAHAGRVLRAFLSDLVYLGPLRESPERHYVFSGNVANAVGKTGRHVPDLLFKDRRLLRRVNEQLKAFDIGYELVITGAPGGELHDVFSVRLKDVRTGVSASILDVGFGISQVLPVIVQSMLSTGKTLCIEQPEIHLHPKLQADLGSLIAESIGAPYHNRFIIETHSQHLLLRVQRLIRERKLSASQVSVIYVDKADDGSRCLQLRMDEDGSFIDEWPNGFFEEGYVEMFGL